VIPSSVTKVYRRARSWAQELKKPRRRRPIRRLQLETLEERNLLDAGTWTSLTNLAPTQIGTMHLLTDGTVMAQGDGPGVNSITKDWYRLTPDSSGSYVNGSWSQLASMSATRLYFGSNVLPSGKLFVQGGEYSSAGGFTRTGETYDPVTNTWTSHANFPQGSFGDDPTMLLPNGKILGGYISGPQTFLYDPATDSWAATGTKLRNDQSDEETWTLLPATAAHPQGSVLGYDVFASINTGVNHAQLYDIATGTWKDTPFPSNFQTPLLTSPGIGFEFGQAVQLPNGSVLEIGALNRTALFDINTDTWSRGPDIPGGYGADDAPAAILPDGHVIFLADAGPFRGTFSPPTHVFDYDYVSNTITDITSTLPSALQSELASQSAYRARMLVLPTGELLLAPDNQGAGGNKLWIFTPTNGTGNSAWKPTISSITANGDAANSYTLTGRQLEGISQGSSYGDDAESDTNYPIVRLVGGGHVYYAKTTGWTPGVSVVGDPSTKTVVFTSPAPTGDYQVTVIANGIASDPFFAHIVQSGGGGGPGAISGRVFGDPTHNGVDNPAYPGLEGWLVYIDVNHTGQFDPNVDPYQITDPSGAYSFANLAAGSYTIGEVLLPTFVESTPLPPGERTVVVNSGQTTKNVDFGNYQTTAQVLIDDTDPVYFAANGPDWDPNNPNGFNGGSSTHAPTNDPTQNAQWTVTTGTGRYELFATWANNPSFATNATYEIFDGTRLLARVTENQTQATTQANVNGGFWNKLGTFTTTTGTFTIQLDTNGANGIVDADAVFAGAAPAQASVAVVHVGTDETGIYGAQNAVNYLKNDSRFSSVADINVDVTGIPTAAQLAQYSAVLAVTDNRDGFNLDHGGKGTQLGNVLDTYVHNGGRVILSAFAGNSGLGIDGAILNDSPATIGNGNGFAGAMNIPASHPFPFGGVNSFSSFYSSNIGLSAKGIDIANYASGTLGVVTTADNSVMFVNGFPFNQSDYNNGSQFGLLFANALAGASPSELAAEFDSAIQGVTSSVPTDGNGTPASPALAGPSVGFASLTSGAPVALNGTSNLASAPTGTTGAAGNSSSISSVSSLDNLFMSLGGGAMFTPVASPIATSNGDQPAMTGAAFNAYMTSLLSTTSENDDLVSTGSHDEGDSSSQDGAL
jgi:hypothetical protein